MKKLSRLFLITTFALTSSASYAESHCSAVSAQVTDAFKDLNNELSSDSKVQADQLESCASRNNVCVLVKAPAPRWFRVVQASSLSDIRRKNLDGDDAIGSLISISMKDRAGRCILTRFSGGTALVWVLDGWEIANNKVRTLDTDTVQLHGETKSPAEITRESEQLGRKLR